MIRRAVRLAAVTARGIAATVAIARLVRVIRAAPPLSAAMWTTEPTGTISVVVPARDEEGRLGRCLERVVDAPHVVEVIVVDDESTDASAEVARGCGATVVTGGKLPAGWAGKCWALQQGIEAASGEWVVTLDADTVPDAQLPAAAVARAEADGWDLLTLAPRLECPTRPLQLLHPALLTTLVYRFGPPGVGATKPSRTMANGQCQIVRRVPFLAGGGFTPVRHHLIEDVALARHLAAQGARVGFLDATDVLTVRMHDSAGMAWREWARSLALSEVTPPIALAGDVAVVALAQALPLVRVLARRADRLDWALIAARAGTLIGMRRAYVGPGAAYWLSPLADVAAVMRLVLSALSPPRTWRGRTYQRGLGRTAAR